MTQVEPQADRPEIEVIHEPPLPARTSRRGRAAWTAMLAIGLGIAMAPLAFQMFSRAPKGGRMIDEFRPFMTERRLANFVGFLGEINAAEIEYRTALRPAAAAAAAGAADRSALGAVDDWSARWRDDNGRLGIGSDMTQMLGTMQSNLGNFRAVDALPPFPLFPWFFVAPGLMIAGLAAWGLHRNRTGRAPGWPRPAAIVLGAGLVAAPFIFSMETRAPRGNDMINDFKPIMTTAKVRTVQSYFPAIGLAEGQLRLRLTPLAVHDGGGPYPAVQQFSSDWPRISAEFATFLGAMSDNLDNFAAVKALPPFTLFPLFFILPGLLVIGLAITVPRRSV